MARPATIFGLVKVQCAFCDKWMSPLQRDKHGPKCYAKAVKAEQARDAIAQAKGESNG